MVEMEQEAITQTAKGISELGMLVMGSAFFLVLSATILIGGFTLFKKFVNRMLDDNKLSQDKLIEAINEQSSQLVDVAEGLREKTLNEIKIVSGSLFDLCKGEISKIIKTIRSENHIEDKEATIEKIQKMVVNVHENRNSKFDSFKFKGKPLSSYTSHKWVDQLSQLIEKEIYSDKVNSGRTETNINNLVESIKLDFYHNLTGGAA